MILTKQEKQHIIIWRLLRKISTKHNEGYYSLEINPNTINKKYYTPTKTHCQFDSAEETIQSLKNLLNMNSVEYRFNMEEMAKKLVETRNKKKEVCKELKELEKGYNEAINKITNPSKEE